MSQPARPSVAISMKPLNQSNWRLSMVPLRRRLLLAAISLIAAAAIWLPCLHFCFRPPPPAPKDESEVQPLAAPLAAQQLYLWTDPDARQKELARMRGTNAEWDFMGRTFLVLAMANQALRHGEQKAACLEVVDRIIDETLKTEREKGIYHFLMPYARHRPFVMQPTAEPVPRRRDRHDAGGPQAGPGERGLPRTAP